MRALTPVSILAILLVPGVAIAAECPGSLLGELTEGPVHSLALYAGHLYIGSGATLLTYSLADPANPVRTSAVPLHGVIEGITATASHLFVASGDAGLEILDLLDPAHPAPLSRLPMPERAASVAVAGNRAYAVILSSLRILDVSSPAAPLELGAWVDENKYLYDVEVAGSHAFVTYYGAFTGGLLSIDVSDPSSPVLAGQLNIGSVNGRIAVTGTTAYLAAGSEGLSVVDISNPQSPTSVGTYDPGYVSDVAVTGGRAYVATDAGLRILDLTDPAHPVEIGALPGPWHQRVAATGGLAAVETEQWGETAELIDVSNPSTPLSLWSLDAPDAVVDVAIDGSSAFLAAGDEGLRVVDFSSPANPLEIGAVGFSPGSYVTDVVAGAGRAYLADDVLRIVDVSNPADPAEISSLALAGDIYELAVAGARVYALTVDFFTPENGLRIVDVADPAAPIEVGYYPGSWSSPFGDLEVNGTTVVLSTSLEVRVLDTTDPSVPMLVSTIDLPNANSLAMGGALLAAASWLGPQSRRLDLVDLTDPAAPVVLGTHFFTASGPTDSMSVTSTWVVIHDAWGALLLFDITNPSRPFKVGSYDPPGFGSGVAITGDLVVSGNTDAGISILSASGISSCWFFSDGFESGDTSSWSLTEP
jgi:hypothetical protein